MSCNIVFFGTSEIAVPILERLRSDADLTLLEVVTQPDRPAGRKHLLTAPPVKRAAQQLELPVWQPETLRDEEALAHLQKLGADVFVVVSYGNILPGKLLAMPRLGGVNVHPSLLPAYRGATPIPAAIAAGDKETGVTIMVMTAKMDEGPILDVARLPIADRDTTATLSAKLAQLGATMIGPVLKAYASGQITPQEQDHAKATTTRILKREDGLIDWSRSAVEIERFVRAMQPWPEAFTFWTRGEKRLKLTVTKTEILHPTAACDGDGRPSVACKLANGTLGVTCGTGSLQILELRPEGKATMEAKAFLNGYPDVIGSTLQ